LTDKSSKFRNATQNLVKIKVVEEEKIYNFDVGQKLIPILELAGKQGLKLS